VIVGDDGGICASAIRMCKIKGIPTLGVQVGLLTKPIGRDIFDFLRYKNYLLWKTFSKIIDNRMVIRLLLAMNFRFINFEWGSSDPDIIAVMSEYHRDILIKRGISPNKIIVTGYVLVDEVIDYISSYNAAQKKYLFGKLGLDPQKKSNTSIDATICRG